jgi:hypothetical protein
MIELGSEELDETAAFTVGIAVAFTVGVVFTVAAAFTVGIAVAFTVGLTAAFTVGVAVAVTVGLTAAFTVGVAVAFIVGFTVGVGVTLGAGVAVGLMVGVVAVHASLSVLQLPPLLKSTIELYCRYTKKPPLSQAVLTDALTPFPEAVFPRFAGPAASLYHDPVPSRAPPVSSQRVCRTGAFPSSPIQIVGYFSLPGPARESHAI